jgi:hypothetical protein
MVRYFPRLNYEGKGDCSPLSLQGSTSSEFITIKRAIELTTVNYAYTCWHSKQVFGLADRPNYRALETLVGYAIICNTGGDENRANKRAPDSSKRGLYP